MNKKNPELAATALICFGLISLVLWVYYMAVFGENLPEIRRKISVVLYDAGDDGWESLMEGMRQAEEDFAVDINYIVAKENSSGAEQLELVRKEIANGAQGVLLTVEDSGVMFREAQNQTTSVPIVTLLSNTETENYTFISADNFAMGKTLGEALLADYEGKEKPTVVVIEGFMERDSMRQRAEGLYLALGDKAEIIVIEKKEEQVEMSLFLANFLKRTEADAVVALSKVPLQALCKVSPEIMAGKKVYGIGNASSTVAALDKGQIEKLVFQNEFNVGYLGVETLLQQIGGIQTNAEKIDFYCVGKEDIHETQYERLLFPIIE